MKKLLIMLLAIVMLLSVVACGGAGNGGETSGDETTAGDESTGGGETATALTYAEYIAAEEGAEVTIEAYVQATQGWWSDNGQGKITVYLQDKDGAYFAYELACEEADAAGFTKGRKIRVTGEKGVWNGEIEIMNGTFTFVENADTYVATATDVTSLLGTEQLIDHQNKFVSFKGLTVVAKNAEGAAYFYKWDNSGSEGDDLYFDVTDGTNTYSFTVESYLTGKDSDVYKAVKELNVGDKIDMEGFLYWYEGVNPHITSVTVVTAAQ